MGSNEVDGRVSSEGAKMISNEVEVLDEVVVEDVWRERGSGKLLTILSIDRQVNPPTARVSMIQSGSPVERTFCLSTILAACERIG